MPHGHCYLWSPAMVWTQVTANTLIGVAYVSISAMLTRLAWRVRLPFSWVYIAFGAFILACGMTHFLDVATVWHPIYWVDAGVRVITATASVTTALLLVPLTPKVIALAKVTEVAKASNLELRKSEERLRLLIDGVKEYAIFLLDPSGVVTSWNAGAERLNGYRADEIIGQHFSKFYPTEQSPIEHGTRELSIAQNEGRFEEEGWRVRSDGTRFWASVIISPIFDATGQLLSFVKVTRDLTERREAEDARSHLAAQNATLLEKTRTQEFQERFIGILGHDLRNPLAAIQMGVDLLRRHAGAAEAKALNRMESSAARMSRMIEQILDLTRSGLGGGLPIKPAPTDLREILKQIVEELRVAEPSRSIVLTCDLSDPMGDWDRDRLEQVFSNIVGNAIHHGDPNQPVTVEAEQVGDLVRVRVHNGGPAIPEELLGKLFDPFRRGTRDSRTARTAGLGLGLHISHEVVAAHGGSIEAKSSASEGTTFAVTLPRKPKRSKLRGSKE